MIYFGKTDVGKKRKGNQDNFGIYRLADNILLLAVCDGMGGVGGGEEASRIALDAFSDEIKAVCLPRMKEDGKTVDMSGVNVRILLGNAAEEANSAVLGTARRNPELTGMGTTLVALFIADGNIYSINVGDSRIYRINDGKITQITHDHSYVQYLVDMGKLTPEEAKNSTNRNIITRAVGTTDGLEADVDAVDRGEGEHIYFLLCSDGLTNMVTDEDIAKTVSGDEPLEKKVAELIEKANKNGGADNITALLLGL